ncbi:MAG: glycosyltransferase family 2 protein [Chloroflexota bacterium]
MNARKISIITPSLNRADLLKVAIQSVVAQRYPNYEHIIIDGGSTDETREVVRGQPHIKFVCEPDRGMYDALNKGVKLANGDVIGFLNTDDLYGDDIFKTVMKVFEDEHILAVAGRAEVFSETADGKREISARYFPEDKSLLECSTIGKNYFNAWFFRKIVFERIGAFNAGYQVAGDRDLMLRIALKRMPFTTIDKLVYLYRRHPDSLTFDNSGNKRELSAKDHLAMTTYYLKHENLSTIEKDLIVQLHTRECLELAKRYKSAGNFVDYVSIITHCLKYDFGIVWKVLWQWVRNTSDRTVKIGRYIKKFAASVLRHT